MTPPGQPRIAPLTADEARDLLGDNTRPLNIFLTLAKNQELFQGFMALGSHLLGRHGLPRREREIVILRVGWRSGSDYEFGQHTLIGRRVGLTDDEITRLARDGVEGWPDDDAALVALADELCRDNEVGADTWSRLTTRWSEAELLELVVLAGFYRLVSGFLRTVGVQREPGTPGFPGESA